MTKETGELMNDNNSDMLFSDVYNNVLPFRDLILRISKIAKVIHQQGWAEANAGNISIRISNMLIPFIQKNGWENNYPYQDWFLVSKTGSRFRDMIDEPENCLMIIGVGNEEHYFPEDAKPTSEWLCHRKMQEMNKNTNLSCILHTHPTEVIALSNTSFFIDNKKYPKCLNEHFYEALPEIRLFLPQGIAIADYAPPGSSVLAKKSCKSINDKQALIWEKHGLLVIAENIDIALDLTEVINKAAKLCLLKLLKS
ncbi:MAG: class II aldolase/adducin family protein [Candidatus Cloacimonas sp.]|nr:class II aldolase/adducin family protein [Candidatus Cloacimonas sp.]